MGATVYPRIWVCYPGCLRQLKGNMLKNSFSCLAAAPAISHKQAKFPFGQRKQKRDQAEKFNLSSLCVSWHSGKLLSIWHKDCGIWHTAYDGDWLPWPSSSSPCHQSPAREIWQGMKGSPQKKGEEYLNRQLHRTVDNGARLQWRFRIRFVA